MKPLLLGACLALVWVLCGMPVAVPVTVLPVLVEPVTIAFFLGLAARPYLARSRRWTS
ncbi:hypothetical protein [Streptomyces ossamyceticus]|uniref:hypothetical protein n=1 Tax=Streptomyces ossamyceticus TaxID=249581 RepID=UPI00343C8BA3